MKIQYENFLMSSVKLWAEHVLLDKGEAFTNSSGFLYDVKDVWNGYFTYSLPYQPLVSNRAIPTATIMSGVFLDNTFITPGNSGLIDINFEKAEVYFSSEIVNSNTRLSGNYSIADFNVKLTNVPEEKLIFETKYNLKPKIGQTVTGLNPNDTTYPIIYLKNYGGRSDPFCFGGTDRQMTNVRMIVIADSQFAADAVGSIFKEKVRTLIPLLTGLNEMPYNNLGGYSNGLFNYRNLTTNNSIWVENVDVNNLQRSSYAELESVNPHAFINIIDLALESYRNPRI